MTKEYQAHAGAVDSDGTPPDSPCVQYDYEDGVPGGGDHAAKYVRLAEVIYPDTANGRKVEYQYDSGIDDALSRVTRITGDITKSCGWMTGA